MKKGLLTVLCLMVLLGSFVSVAVAEEEKEQKGSIVTSGEAKVWIEPDRARVFLGIETMAGQVDLAREENASKIKKVMGALKALKIKDMLIKAPSYNVSLVKEREHVATKEGRLPKIIGYKVRQDFTVLLQNKDALILSKDAAQVIDTALDNGVNIIQNVSFFKEDDSQDRRAALKLAVENGIANAKAIAKTAGLSIEEYTRIDSSVQYWQPRNQMTRQMFSGGGGVGSAPTPTTLAAGKIAISSKVTLHCSVK